MANTILSIVVPALASLLVTREAALRWEHPTNTETEATVLTVIENLYVPDEPRTYVVVQYSDGKQTRDSAISYAGQLRGYSGPNALAAAQKSYPIGSTIRVRHAPGYPRFGLKPLGM